MFEEIDLHNNKKKYAKYIEKVNKEYTGQAKEILTKYITWHNEAINKGTIVYSSANRSLEEALKICDQFQRPFDITQNQLEKWFETETKRNSLQRTGGDSLKDTGKSISQGTIHKTQSQMIKFLKFCDFLKLNKPLNLFSSKRIPLPLIAQFCIIDADKNKSVEPPLVSQEQVKELLDYLVSSHYYLDNVVGVAVAVMNDTGMRLGECLNLRHENLRYEEGHWLVQAPTSKTKTRTNIILLSKDYLSKWLARCPTKGDKTGLIFCTKKGTKLNYGLMRLRFQEALKKKNISWMERSSFHYLRHLAASRFADWPENLLRYYLGWEGGGMRQVYSAYNWKTCLPYLIKSNKGNPMLDAKLSYMDEQEKDFVSQLEEDLYKKILSKMQKQKSRND